MKSYLFLFSFFLVGMGLQAQISYPRISPKALSEQQIGLTTVSVSYSRPAVRGRKIMGELVPFGRIWRVGANESTKITVDKDISVMGKTLKTGTYALYAFPSETEWQFAFHTNTEHWGDGRDAYDPSEDVFRITVLPEKLERIQENFLITFDGIDHNQADMILQWEYTRLVIPLSTDTEAMMNLEIANQLENNPSAQTYYESARYLLEQSKDAETALEYVNKAIEIGGDTYYYFRVKSELEASLGQYEAAIRSAEQSMEIADELGKDEFVRMNQRHIENWRQMINSSQKK